MSYDPRKQRNAIRNKRRALSISQASSSASRLARVAHRHPLLHKARHIAAYIASDGEMNVAPLLRTLWQQGKIIYLPVLVPHARGTLWFARYAPGDPLTRNRFGISEPLHRTLIKPRNLDLVLTPLVAFDHRGNRMGMGGGYYDRSFAFLRLRRLWRKPHLLGIAYDFQRLATIRPNPWDIPLDGILTESSCYLSKR